MPQSQYAKGTQLKSPTGTITVEDPNQFYNEQYQPVEKAINTVYAPNLQSNKANDAAVNTLYNSYFGRDAKVEELKNWGMAGGADTTVGALETFLQGERTKNKITTPIMSLAEVAKSKQVPEKAVTDTNIPPNGTEPFVPPVPTAKTEAENYVAGIAANVDAQRAQIDKIYKDQIAKADSEKADLQKQIDELTKQEGIDLSNKQNLSQPFNQKLEETERKRLGLEDYYFANQKSLGEMESLMKQALTEVEAMKSVTGLDIIRNPRITAKVNDYNARIGVIQAVMASRDKLFAQGEDLINRTVTAINADRKDQLAYYDAVLTYHGKLKDDKGNQIIKLDEKEKAAIDAQTALIKNDLAQSEAVATAIKDLVISDPDKVEGAGIKLTDSLPQIAKKLSDYDYNQGFITMKNKMIGDDYKYLSTMDEVKQMQKSGRQVIAVTDTRGIDHFFAAPLKKKTTGTTTTLTPEEKSFATDLEAARKDLAAANAKGDKTAWGRNWDFLKNQYDTPNDTLDQLLNKDKYYPTESNPNED